MKAFRTFLLVLIVIGLILLFTQNIWVPKLVNKIILSEDNFIVIQPTSIPIQIPKPKVIFTPPLTSTLNGEKIIRKVREQEGSFLIQKINSSSVDGLWYQAYPVATENGTPKTLHIGDDIGYVCEGISEKLINIDFSGQKITFNKVTSKTPLGGCPI